MTYEITRNELKKFSNESMEHNDTILEYAFNSSNKEELFQKISENGDIELSENLNEFFDIFNLSHLYDNFKQRAITFIIDMLPGDGTLSQGVKKIIAQVLQNFSPGEVYDLFKDPSCEKISPTVSLIVSEFIGEEIADLINSGADKTPVLNSFVSGGNTREFLATTIFGTGGEALGDKIRAHPVYDEYVTQNIENICNEIVDLIKSADLSALFSGVFKQ